MSTIFSTPLFPAEILNFSPAWAAIFLSEKERPRRQNQTIFHLETLILVRVSLSFEFFAQIPIWFWFGGSRNCWIEKKFKVLRPGVNSMKYELLGLGGAMDPSTLAPTINTTWLETWNKKILQDIFFSKPMSTRLLWKWNSIWIFPHQDFQN